MIQEMRTRRLYRSRKNVMLVGVAGGVAEYFDMDPTVVRVLFIIASLLIPVLPIVYLLMALIMPVAPTDGAMIAQRGAPSAR